MSEQQGQPVDGETGSVGTGPAAPGMSDAPAMAHAVTDVASPQIAPIRKKPPWAGACAQNGRAKAECQG